MTFQQKRYVTHGGPRMTFQLSAKTLRHSREALNDLSVTFQQKRYVTHGGPPMTFQENVTSLTGGPE